eukprot:COSAG02_NODE_10958_length_1824_cov_10.888696_1_plen_70_part_10
MATQTFFGMALSLLMCFSELQETKADACSNPSSQWHWPNPEQGSEIVSVETGSPLRAGTWPNCGVSLLTN